MGSRTSTTRSLPAGEGYRQVDKLAVGPNLKKSLCPKVFIRESKSTCMGGKQVGANLKMFPPRWDMHMQKRNKVRTGYSKNPSHLGKPGGWVWGLTEAEKEELGLFSSPDLLSPILPSLLCQGNSESWRGYRGAEGWVGSGRHLPIYRLLIIICYQK